MLSIQECLENIKNAVLGRDVRQSIHDGIKGINDESKADMEAKQTAIDEYTKRQDNAIEEYTKRQNEVISDYTGKLNVLNNKYEEQIKNMTLESPSDAEIVDARMNELGTAYSTLKERIDTDIGDLKQDLFSTYTLELEKDTDIPTIKSNIVYGNGKYLALTENGYCVSEDGENWGRYDYENFSGEFIAGYIAGKFIVCGPPDKGIYISATAEIGDWQNINGPGVAIKAIHEIKGRHFMIDKEGHLLEILNDISTPSYRPILESYVFGITDMTYGNGHYVMSTTSGLLRSSDDLVGIGKITDAYDADFINMNFMSVSYGNGKFITVTQDGKIYISEDKFLNNWKHTFSLNNTVTKQIEYLNGSFYITCGRKIYATEDGKGAKSFIASLHEITATVNVWNKIALYDTESRVTYVYAEKRLREQVHELNQFAGKPEELNTVTKTDLVSAVNELKSGMDNVYTKAEVNGMFAKIRINASDDARYEIDYPSGFTINNTVLLNVSFNNSFFCGGLDIDDGLSNGSDFEYRVTLNQNKIGVVLNFPSGDGSRLFTLHLMRMN